VARAEAIEKGGRSMIRYVAGIIAAIASPSFAQDYSPFSAERSGSTQYHHCISVSDSQVETGQCEQAEFERQDAFLAIDFKGSLSGDVPDMKAQKLKAHQAWRIFRQENCKVRLLNGGSGSGSFYYGCLIRETIARRQEIINVWDY